ncbi:MAG: hypothetical protein JNJ83_24680 [Verrucomicrobiaceae bacterium]|nr:hypothetical protein [Verrucomicrobiaceae bacterium]
MQKLLPYLLMAAAALAQQPVPTPAPPPTPIPPPVIQPPPVVKPRVAPAPQQPVRERERRIYVPYEELGKVFTDGGKGVFLPYREFLELWNELTLKREEEEKVPVEAVVTKAEYTGQVVGEALVLEGRLTAESFKTGWNTVSLGQKDIVGLAEANTGKAVLKRAGEGYDLMLPDKGVYDITLKMILPIEQTAGRSRIAAAFPKAAVSRVVMTLPGEGLELQSKTGAFTSRPIGGSTEVSLVFGNDYSSDLSWGLPQAVTTMTPLLLAFSELDSLISAGSIQTTASVQLRVMRAPMAEFKISVPAGQEVLGVTGAGVKSWGVSAGPEGRSLVTISPDKPVKDELRVQINLESVIAALPSEVSVPNVVVEGAAYARGTAIVRSEPQYDVTPKVMQSVVRSSTQVEAQGEKMAVGAFRLLKQPWTFTTTVEEARPQVEVTSLTRTEILRDVMKVDAQFNYSVRRVGLFELRLGLPPDLVVTDVSGDGIGEWKADAGSLLVKLAKQTTGNINLRLQGRQNRKTPTDDVTLPVFASQNVVRYEAKLGIGVHSSLEPSTKAAGDLQQEDVNALPAEAKNGSGTELVLAFRHRDTAKPAVLALKPRDPQVSAEVLTRVEAREQSTRHVWTVLFDVSYAAVDRVVVAVPKAVAEQVRIEPESLRDIKETIKTHTPTETENKLPNIAAFALWEIVLRSERMGQFSIALSYEKQGALEAGKTGSVELLSVHVPGAFQETGQVAVTKDNSLELRNPKPDGLEEIDARELKAQLQRDGVFQAYKYRSPPVKLSVETAKNAYFPIPQAVITHADLTTAVASDEAQSTEVIYWVKNIDLQFLVVTLPKGATLVSDVFVGKEGQQPMRREGSEDLLIRLPSGGNAAKEAVPVRFVYEVKSTRPGSTLRLKGTMSVAASSAGGVKVMQTRHRLFLPLAYHYPSFDGPLSQTLSDRGWMRVRRLIDPLIPALGPNVSRVSNEITSAPKEVGADTRSLYDFQVPNHGTLITLHRLGEPATVGVHYQSKKVTYAWEAGAFLLVLLCGIRGLKWPLGRKVGFLVMVAAAATLATGLLNTVNMLIAFSALYAAVVVAALWFAFWVLGLFARDKKAKPDAPRDPPASTPPSAPKPTPTAPTPAPTAAPPPASPPTHTAQSGATMTVDSSPVSVIQLPEVKEDNSEPKA